MTTHTDDLSSYGYPTPLTKPSYNPGSCSDNTPSFDCVERWIWLPLWIWLLYPYFLILKGWDIQKFLFRFFFVGILWGGE